MIAGGGLGDVHPDEVGPISMQEPNGVVDVVVADEAEAVAVTKRLLAYFQGHDRRPATSATKHGCAQWFPSVPGAPIRWPRSSRRWPTKGR